jgi:ADP-heptose:LPS heptosyltransferase
MTANLPPESILMIQLGDIGDVVLATASFQALRDSLPGARVFALVRKGCASLLSADPALTGIFESRRGGGNLLEAARENLVLARSLRAERFDLVIDLRTGDRGALLALLTRAREKVAYAGDGAWWRRHVFTTLFDNLAVAPPPAHPGADQSLRILRAAGFAVGNFTPRLHVSGEADTAAREILSAAGVPPGERFITINPFSRWKYKEWNPDGWGEVIAWLGERHGLKSVLTGTREESGAAAGILAKAGAAGVTIAGKTSLGELAAVIRRSSLHLGVDSAAPHMAAALGTPSLTLFGPSDWRAWIVAGELCRVVTPDMPCIPCNQKGCAGKGRSTCIEGMPAKRMLDALEEMLPAVLARPVPTGRQPPGGRGPSR